MKKLVTVAGLMNMAKGVAVMAKEVKVAIYARVSTTGKGQDPETQLIQLRDYCQRRGWTWKEYVDVGASGSSVDRPALNELQKDIHYHRVNVVVIWKIDRLCRNTRELLAIADDWKQRNIDLVITTTDIDTTTPGGKLVFRTLGIVADFERETLIERVNAGLARARREGKRLGRPKDKVRIPPEVAEAIQNGKLSVYRAAQETGIPRSTLKRRLKERGTVGNSVKRDGVPNLGTPANVGQYPIRATDQKGSVGKQGEQGWLRRCIARIR